MAKLVIKNQRNWTFIFIKNRLKQQEYVKSLLYELFTAKRTVWSWFLLENCSELADIWKQFTVPDNAHRSQNKRRSQ